MDEVNGKEGFVTIFNDYIGYIRLATGYLIIDPGLREILDGKILHVSHDTFLDIKYYIHCKNKGDCHA